MLHALTQFGTYLATTLVLLTVFIFAYVKFTPYNEFDLIRGYNNEAAAISLSGASIGFTIPLVACVYYTASISEMCVWAAITAAVQLLLFTIMRYASEIRTGKRAPALFLAALSVCIGALSAVCISH